MIYIFDTVYPEESIASSQQNTHSLTQIIRVLFDHLLECLKETLTEACQEDHDKIRRKIMKTCAPSCVILCASHRHIHPWTSSETKQATEGRRMVNNNFILAFALHF